MFFPSSKPEEAFSVTYAKKRHSLHILLSSERKHQFHVHLSVSHKNSLASTRARVRSHPPPPVNITAIVHSRVRLSPLVLESLQHLSGLRLTDSSEGGLNGTVMDLLARYVFRFWSLTFSPPPCRFRRHGWRKSVPLEDVR